MRLWVPPSLIRPFHPVKNHRRVRELAASMREVGWIDRPVLAEIIREAPTCSPKSARAASASSIDLRSARSSPRYQAWTAAHRIAAARIARLPVIPVHLVADQAGKKLASGRLLVRKRGAYLFSLPSGWYDDDRMQFLLTIGDASSAAILRAELEANLAEDRHHAWKVGRSWAVSQRDAG